MDEKKYIRKLCEKVATIVSVEYKSREDLDKKIDEFKCSKRTDIVAADIGEILIKCHALLLKDIEEQFTDKLLVDVLNGKGDDVYEKVGILKKYIGYDPYDFVSMIFDESKDVMVKIRKKVVQLDCDLQCLCDISSAIKLTKDFLQKNLKKN